MKRILFYFVLLILFLSCNDNSPNSDSFYSDKRGFDYSRIPLIKPYEVQVVIPGSNWILRSIDRTMLSTIPGVQKINIVDKTILLYSKNTLIDYQIAKEGWFVIIPSKRIVKSFRIKNDYSRFIYFLGFKQEPQLYDISLVFNYYDDNDYIDWRKIN